MGNETLEILEAYTRKADGRVVPVDQSQIATQDGAVGPYSSLVDIKVKQIPFRDLGVGDTWVLSYRITEKDHFFPGQFSWALFHIDARLRNCALHKLRAHEMRNIRDTREKPRLFSSIRLARPLRSNRLGLAPTRMSLPGRKGTH